MSAAEGEVISPESRVLSIDLFRGAVMFLLVVTCTPFLVHSVSNFLNMWA